MHEPCFDHSLQGANSIREKSIFNRRRIYFEVLHLPRLDFLTWPSTYISNIFQARHALSRRVHIGLTSSFLLSAYTFTTELMKSNDLYFLL